MNAPVHNSVYILVHPPITERSQAEGKVGAEVVCEVYQKCSSEMANRKWENEEIERLLDAYEAEPCLYVVKHPNYHNKHLRSEALKRIIAKLQDVREGTEESEIIKKIHSLRNNFNSENRKVKKSVQSGCGTSDVYVPSVWYFNKMKFLEEHFVPRKSVSVGRKSETHIALGRTQDSDSIDAIDTLGPTSEGFTAGGDIFQESQNIIIEDHDYFFTPVTEIVGSDIPTSPTDPTSSISNSSASIFIPPRPRSPSECSTGSSTPSHSGTFSSQHTPKRRRTANKGVPDPAMEQLIEKLSSPIVLPPSRVQKNNTPVDSLMETIGGIIKRIPNERDQEEIMLEVLSLVITRKSELASEY